jgi:thiamine-monophosphate kinase
MMDLSDGLSLDLQRLCAASRAGAVLFAHRIPAPAIPAKGDAIELALHGGEDYQLLFTVPQARAAKIPSSFRRVPLSCIGEIRNSRGIDLVTPDGRQQPLESRGYDHFAGSESRIASPCLP